MNKLGEYAKYFNPSNLHDNSVRILSDTQNIESTIIKRTAEIGANIRMVVTGTAATFKEGIKFVVSLPTAIFITNVALRGLRLVKKNAFSSADDTLPTIGSSFTTLKKTATQGIGAIVSVAATFVEIVPFTKPAKWNIQFQIWLGNVGDNNIKQYAFNVLHPEVKLQREEEGRKAEEAAKKAAAEEAKQKAAHNRVKETQKRQLEQKKLLEKTREKFGNYHYTDFTGRNKGKEKLDDRVRLPVEDNKEPAKPSFLWGIASAVWSAFAAALTPIENNDSNSQPFYPAGL